MQLLITVHNKVRSIMMIPYHNDWLYYPHPNQWHVQMHIGRGFIFVWVLMIFLQWGFGQNFV